jgi:YVTN family beta-propeller protein
MANVNFNTASFSFVNNKTQSLVVYSTLDPNWNLLTFTLLNNTGVDLTLKGGEPVDEVKADAASSFAFGFRTLLTDAEAKAMVVKDQLEQWGARYFPPEATGNPTWAVAPIKDLVLKNGDKVVFALSNITCKFQQPTSYVDLFYFNVPGVNPRPFPFSYLVAVLNPPVGKDLKSVVDCGVLNGSVLHTIGSQAPPPPGGNGPPPIEVDITYDNNFPIKNGLTVYLKNTTNSPLVPPETPLGGAIFTVSFLFGTQDDNAITSQALGDIITIGIDAESQWTSNKHQQGTSNWIFTPLSKGLMAKNETVNLIIGNIITDLNVNPQTLSSMHVQWNFVPGYADGYFSIELQKQKANPRIPSFNVVPPVINLGQNVQISYQTMVSAYITLGYVRRDGTSVLLTSPQDIGYNEQNFPAAPDKEATVFNLSVYRGPGQPVDASATCPVAVNQPPAKINSFTATSYLVNINSSNTIDLKWDVENAKTVIVVGYGVQTGKSLPNLPVNATTTYTLQAIPWGSDGQMVQASLTVYAYKSYPSVPVGPMGDGTAFQSLPLSLSNRLRQMIYVSNSAANKVYQVMVANKQVSPTQFAGNIMALSADELKLFVAEQRSTPPGLIHMYDTGNPATVSTVNQPGPPPYSMAINPACSRLYYLQQHRLTAVSSFNVNEGANNFSYLKDLTVGTSPEAYAFDAAGANLYVGNYDSASVSVINLNQNAVTATIKLQGNDTPTYARQPCAFALVGSLLFVACSGENRVCVIDISNNTMKPPITAGFQPFSLTLDQNKARLFVTNFQGGSVTVIDTAALAVTTTLKVGNGPSAAKITDSGKLMFVSNYCDKSLSVVDISNGGATVVGTIPLESSNGNPVDVSTFPSINFYTDVFVAKEYFLGRNNGCPGSKATDANLNMSIFSVQEKPASKKAVH